MFTDYFATGRKRKTWLLYVTVKERLSSKLHNDALADVITDYCGVHLVITVTIWEDCSSRPASLFTRRQRADTDLPEWPEHLLVTLGPDRRSEPVKLGL